MMYPTPEIDDFPGAVIQDDSSPAYTMPCSTFQALIRDSAGKYLNYLEASYRAGRGSGGRKEILVTRIEGSKFPDEYIFCTSEKIKMPDACEVFVFGRHISSIKLSAMKKTNRGEDAIQVRGEDGYLRSLTRFGPADIKIISDLRYLIRKLQSFYCTHYFTFSPPPPQELPELPSSLLKGLSDEQLRAVAGVFESPISYINGAPGTGKTRMVLSRCVLRYVLAGKRVYLLAPTNNAVEQMLRSILPVLKEAGVRLDLVYRFGIPSEEFAAEYPEVVGNAAADAIWENLQAQYTSLKGLVDKAHVVHNICSVRLSVLESRRAIREELLPRIDQLRDAREKCSEASRLLSSASAALKSAQKQCAELSYDLNTVDSKRQRLYKAISERRQQSETFLNRFIFRENHRRLLAEIEQLTADLEVQNTAYRNLSVSFKASTLAQADTEKDRDACKAAVSEAEHELNALLKSLPRFSTDDPEMKSAISAVLSRSEPDTSLLDTLVAEAEAAYQKASEEAAAYDLNEIESLLAGVEKEIAIFKRSPNHIQKEAALILAGTVDASLSHIVPEEGKTLRPAHVFLDEAGYTSLARGMVAFSCGAPVTFLGDHRQLPPVCEMNKIDEANSSVCLWSLPVAYTPELIHGDPIELYNDCYYSGIAPSFQGIAFYNLTTSYRFGPVLADILAQYIYSEGFRGVSNAPFEILVLDASRSPGPKSRTSTNEVKAIQSFLAANPTEDFAVLTPYRHQHSLLRMSLPLSAKDRILTVHRSQGREWDTVFLSVTDADRPYFTDSRLPVGRSVVNTAISRTKRRLVIVCDISAWDKMPDQMISALIRSGTRIDPPYTLS